MYALMTYFPLSIFPLLPLCFPSLHLSFQGGGPRPGCCSGSPVYLHPTPGCFSNNPVHLHKLHHHALRCSAPATVPLHAGGQVSLPLVWQWKFYQYYNWGEPERAPSDEYNSCIFAMFISVRPPLGVSGSSFKIRRNLMCTKCIAKLATLYSGHLKYCMHVWPRSNWTSPLLPPFVHVWTATMTLYFCSWACKRLWMLQDTFSRQRRKAATLEGAKDRLSRRWNGWAKRPKIETVAWEGYIAYSYRARRATRAAANTHRASEAA